ncbi:MAG: helix-turn-helix transcriptional regulator [Acidobacteriota bacterium]
MEPETETRRMIARLRRLVDRSPLTRRQVEVRAGFSRGYITQLFAERIDLKYQHVIAILSALDLSPARFFRQAYPPLQSGYPALEAFRDEAEAARAIERAQKRSAASMRRLTERVARCEAAIAQLEARGLFDDDASGGDP